MNQHIIALLMLMSETAHAKPATPVLRVEEPAKAAQTQAVAAHTAKVDAYKTCLASEKVAGHYFKNHPQAARPARSPACTDPGSYVAAATVAPAAAADKARPAALPRNANKS